VSNPSTPSEIARETIRQLAARRIPPTPDSYATLYAEIAGSEEGAAGLTALRVLDRVALNVVNRSAPRPTDTIARYGGEEFVLLLPNTTIDGAVEVMRRVQRDLTRRIFLRNNERLLITFSAGVTLRRPGEDGTSAIARADEAMLRAKQEGKNRVVAFEGER
jgi:GGDEF domain-containing protein